MKYSYDKGYIEDFQMWLKIAKDNQIGYVDEYLALYRVGNTLSLSSNISKMQMAEYEIVSRYSSEKIFPKAIAYWNIRWFSTLYFINKKQALKKYFIKIIFSPFSYINKNFYKLILKIMFGLKK